MKLQFVLPCKDREGSDIMLIRYSEMRREDKREKKQRDSRWGEATLPPSACFSIIHKSRKRYKSAAPALQSSESAKSYVMSMEGEKRI